MPRDTHTTSRRPEIIGVLLYVIAAGLFAFNGAVAKLAIEAGLDPLRLVQLRNAGGLIVLAVIVLIFNRSAFRIRRGELKLLIAYGVVAFAIVQFLYFFAVSRLPLQASLDRVFGQGFHIPDAMAALSGVQARECQQVESHAEKARPGLSAAYGFHEPEHLR